ncbi:MAG: amino acid permease [Chloroflexi bacterium]|nr:amino acid permease [Chloroflexota bacterium]
MQPSHQQPSLKRSLGLLEATMIGVGAMIGAGIFGLTGIAAGKAGPVGLLIAFFLNGIVTSLTGLTYAELGAAMPEAGGGYLWVREGLSRFWGFFAGWISWFSHSVACSLYAVLFATFFVELMELAGLHLSTEPGWFLGLSQEQWAIKGLVIVVVALFLFINYRGASETGLVGNIVTITKVAILLTIVAFGIKAMLNAPSAMVWSNFQPPLAHGWMGVFAAMGLTFVAFEGYEIIAQTGEELHEPEKNLPRSIFLSIAIVVAIYLLVAFVAVGVPVQDIIGMKPWQYLAEHGERGMVRIAQFIMPYGHVLMLIGGLASTTSALNATVYSSSRVSFAMGRGGDLPEIFSRVHPKTRTPHWAILISGVLIAFMGVALPVADVASGASLTFLALFLLTNFTLVRLRKTHPDLPRPFKVPFVPYLPIATVIIQGFLAGHLFETSPLAWYATILWVIVGIVFYKFWVRGHQKDVHLIPTTPSEEA